MSFSYDRYDSRSNRRLFTGPSNRTAFGYWIPLVITVTAATAGLAAWVWSERSDAKEEEEEFIYENDDYYESEVDEQKVEEARERWRREHGGASVTHEHEEQVAPGAPAESQSGPPVGDAAQGAAADFYGPGAEQRGIGGQQGEGFIAQMRGALGRTPSPQQIVESAKQTFNAGVAAVGKGLNSIREDDEDEKRDYFGDQERWSEEAESRERTDDSKRDIGAIGAAAAAGGAMVGAGSMAAARATTSKTTGPANRGRQRMVAVVVSAEPPESSYGDSEDYSTYNIEHASILSHLIGHVNPDKAQLLILIYAPHLERHPLAKAPSTSNKSRRTSTGSYDKLSDMPQQDADIIQPQPPIALEDQDNREDDEGRIINSYTSESSPALYNALATQAATLVSHPTHILPFTSQNGHVHMLKHLAPSCVYIQEGLCGDNGRVVADLGQWVGQAVVVVGDSGAGLVDTETEDEGAKKDDRQGQKWWQDQRRVGFGKGIEVVEGISLGEDWVKRIEGS